LLTSSVLKNRVARTFKVKAPCSPQTVGFGNEELVDEAVVALTTAMELIDVLELNIESEGLLIKVVNVRIDEATVDDVRINEVGVIDSVRVSSARDAELAEIGRREVVDVEVVIDIDSDKVAENTPEEEPVLVSEFGEGGGDDVGKPEEVVTAELALDGTLLEAELAKVGSSEVVNVDVVAIVVVVVDVDADELDEEGCDDGVPLVTKPREERDDVERLEEVG
jgi:hypothetical protein